MALKSGANHSSGCVQLHFAHQSLNSSSSTTQHNRNSLSFPSFQLDVITDTHSASQSRAISAVLLFYISCAFVLYHITQAANRQFILLPRLERVDLATVSIPRVASSVSFLFKLSIKIVNTNMI